MAHPMVVLQVNNRFYPLVYLLLPELLVGKIQTIAQYFPCEGFDFFGPQLLEVEA